MSSAGALPAVGVGVEWGDLPRRRIPPLWPDYITVSAFAASGAWAQFVIAASGTTEYGRDGWGRAGSARSMKEPNVETLPLSLFCLPYAGGSAAIIYRDWARYLPAWIQVHPLELAGHGRRMAEPFHPSIEHAAQDMRRAVISRLRDNPRYALYGHSMGALLAYALASALAHAGAPTPQALFLSGRKPPHAPPGQLLHMLDDTAFLDRIHALGGTPDTFFEQPELVELFLPILRSDHGLIERYRPIDPIHVSSADLVLLYGEGDPLAQPGQMHEWARYSRGRICLHRFDGGHFFLNDAAGAVCALIAAHLERGCGAGGG